MAGLHPRRAVPGLSRPRPTVHWAGDLSLRFGERPRSSTSPISSLPNGSVLRLTRTSSAPTRGWFTPDRRHFFLDDEADEEFSTILKTRTLVFDMNDLDDPIVLTEFFGTTRAIDHNLYINGRYMYQS